jgi:hypothetical protein
MVEPEVGPGGSITDRSRVGVRLPGGHDEFAGDDPASLNGYPNVPDEHGGGR